MAIKKYVSIYDLINSIFNILSFINKWFDIWTLAFL